MRSFKNSTESLFPLCNFPLGSPNNILPKHSTLSKLGNWQWYNIINSGMDLMWVLSLLVFKYYGMMNVWSRYLSKIGIIITKNTPDPISNVPSTPSLLQLKTCLLSVCTNRSRQARTHSILFLCLRVLPHFSAWICQKALHFKNTAKF